jgi:hypothetical protein
LGGFGGYAWNATVTPNGSTAQDIDESDVCPEAWTDDALKGGVEMAKDAYMVIYFLLMIVIIVGADFLFLRDHFVARLMVNIAIVVVFAAVYFIFLRKL